MTFKAGFVNIIGLPNVGKSTLLNAILGEKLSIITPKAQTTRHRILGILNKENYQIIFSDTPGFVNDPAYSLHEKMNTYVSETFQDADVFIFITEVNTNIEKQQAIIERLQKAAIPVFILINKIDLIEDQNKVNEEFEHWQKQLPKAKILPVSALHGFHIDILLKELKDILPEHPPYYSTDSLSNRNERFFVTEIIREKILLHYKQEIPYATQVEIESYKEEKNITRIRALIFVERDTQKSIIIGKNGSAIKRMGTDARKDIEKFLDQKVFLELFVKVKDKWRNDEQSLKKFGY